MDLTAAGERLGAHGFHPSRPAPPRASAHSVPPGIVRSARLATSASMRRASSLRNSSMSRGTGSSSSGSAASFPYFPSFPAGSAASIATSSRKVFTSTASTRASCSRSGGSWPGSVFTGEPLKLPAGHFGLGFGEHAHAPDEYYVIESSKPEVTGMVGATRSFVDYLYALA